MSNNKSSVEWLISQLIFKTEFENLPHQYVLMSDKDIDDIIQQAKAMHKDEITKAWEKGDGKFDKVAEEMSLEYYNETFRE